jgi:hypothetical protein
MRQSNLILAALLCIGVAHAAPNPMARPSPKAAELPPPPPAVAGTNMTLPSLAGSDTSALPIPIKDALKGAYVATVLGERAIIRVPANQQPNQPMAGTPALGQQAATAQTAVPRVLMYKLKNGVPFSLIDEYVLVPKITDSTVTLMLKSKVVFVGSVDSIAPPKPAMPTDLVANDPAYVTLHKAPDLSATQTTQTPGAK